MTKINAQKQLDKTRQLLQELGNALSDLVKLSPDIFHDETIKKNLQDFWQKYEESKERLAKPNFRIATIGTTSAGKSTIVNALIGRRIAPIEAGEMSGGVLRLQHSEQPHLLIEKTPDAAWETGEWSGLSDQEFYDRIKNVMQQYHRARRQREYNAPQITASLPLLPACIPNLLDLPTGIGIEIIDLPGLKSFQDRTNLTIIQQQVNKAFSLVALDYLQVDDTHRQKLLQELKQVVEYSQSRTDSMVFILNRVDQRGADDLPLADRISQLKKEIKDVLSLQDEPDIIPFNARLLYYAQCAWGTSYNLKNSHVDQKTRSELLKNMFIDCASLIEDKTLANRELDDWFSELRKSAKRGELIEPKAMQTILNYALDWSGGKELWKCFKRRVQNSFGELVLIPALRDIFASYDTLASDLDIFIKTRQIDNEKEVQAERQKIAELRDNLHQEIAKITKEFEGDIEYSIEGLKQDLREDTTNQRIEINQYLESGKRVGFATIREAIHDVESNLIVSLIVPVRDALKNNRGAFDLKEQLENVISPPLAADISKAYDHVSRRLMTFALESEYLVKKVRADDPQGKQELEHDERYVILLYYTMKQGIKARAEFLLQGRAKEIEDALVDLVREQLEKLESYLSDQSLSGIGLAQATMSNVRQKISETSPTLPEEIFNFSDIVKRKTTQETEKVGETTVRKPIEETYEEGSCYYKTTKIRIRYETVTIDITEDVEYINLTLPSPDLMGTQWAWGIMDSKFQLWDILCDWIVKRLDEVRDIFAESVNEVTNLADRALEQQLQIIQENFEQKKSFWQDFDARQKEVKAIRQRLQNDLQSS